MKNRLVELGTVLSIGLLLSGCGGSSDSNDGGVSLSPTDIVVERGAVYNATVTDAAGKIAIEKPLENVYTFTDTPKYPVSVVGGWMDVNGDGRKGVEDVALSFPMYSYSNRVTPITTYIADSNAPARDAKLLKLQETFGVDESELLKLPSASLQNTMLLHNAVYSELLKQDNNSSAVNISDINTTFISLQTTATQSSDKTTTQLRVLIETQVVDDLVLNNKLTYISLEESDMSASEKDSYILTQKDFLLSTNLVNFTSVVNANLSTEYISNEMLIEGIDTPLHLSISDASFKIVKNDVVLDTSDTTVVNGDTIKLSFITSGTFDEYRNVSLSIDNEFTNTLAQSFNYADAIGICNSVGLELATYAQVFDYHAANVNNLPEESYWVSDTYLESTNGYVYNTATKLKTLLNKTDVHSVVCTKTYRPLLYSIETMSNPNQAPVANAGTDMKVYYTDSVSIDASLSSDDTGIVSYEWKEGETLLSNSMNFYKDDFSVGVHTLTLTVMDDEGKSSSDTLKVTLYDTFTDILPMDEDGGVKSVSSFSNGTTTTITLNSGSQLYFKITNNLNRDFSVSKFSITSTYNGSETLRASATDLALLNNGRLNPGESINLGFTLSSTQTANYWVGTYELTDTLTGETFTNSFQWNGTSW